MGKRKRGWKTSTIKSRHPSSLPNVASRPVPDMLTTWRPRASGLSESPPAPGEHILLSAHVPLGSFPDFVPWMWRDEGDTWRKSEENLSTLPLERLEKKISLARPKDPNTAGLGVFHVHRCCARAPRSRAASQSWRKEPLVTPSLYGAVLRKGLKSRFGAPLLLPQRDSCNLLSHTPILQLLRSLPMADQTHCWFRGSSSQQGKQTHTWKCHQGSSQEKAPELSQLDGQNGLLDGPDSGLSAATARGRPGFEWVPLHDVWSWCFLLVFFLAFLCIDYLKPHYIVMS